MKVNAYIFLILTYVVASVAGAQSVRQFQTLWGKTPVSGYWTDPSTGLMWAAKDNGKDVNWHKAMKYCQNLRLAGFSDWRLATIYELSGIHVEMAEAPERLGHGKPLLFLTGVEWSSSQVMDFQGRPSRFASYYDFVNGYIGKEDFSRFSGRFADQKMRALCVRAPVK